MSRPRWNGIRNGAANQAVAGHKFCARDGRWRPVSDFAAIKSGGRHDSYCQACRRIASREAFERLTPAQRARQRETNWFYRDRLRREKGIVYRPRGSWTASSRYGPRLDPTALLREIDAYVARQHGSRPDFTHAEVARQAGVSERLLQRLRHGNGDRVRLDAADKLALAIDVPLQMIYPPQ